MRTQNEYYFIESADFCVQQTIDQPNEWNQIPVWLADSGAVIAMHSTIIQ